MSAEKSALSPFAPPPSTEADYEAICAAVMETGRGRWFLAEYAKRNRHADTEAIIAAVDRIEAKLRDGQNAIPSERVWSELEAMAQAIARTRAEIAAITSDATGNDALLETTGELDSIVQTTARATSDILAATEQIQEIAWTAREHGIDGKFCDALDQRATDIYTACTFQDLTGQRTRKVIEVLRFLEERIAAMIEIWGKPTAEAAEPGQRMPGIGLHEPGDHLDQGEIDQMMPAPAEAGAPDQPPGSTADASSRIEALDNPAADEATPALDTQPIDTPPADRTPAPLMSMPTDIATQAEPPQEVSTSEPAAAPARAEQATDAAALLDQIIAMVRVSMSDDGEHASAASARSPQRNASTDIVLPPPGVQPASVARMQDGGARVSPTAAAAPRPATEKVAASYDDPAADILMPAASPISVADAVEQILMSHSPRPPSAGTPMRSVPPPAAPQEQIFSEPVVAEPVPAEAPAASATEPSSATSELIRDAGFEPEPSAEAAPEPMQASPSEDPAREPPAPTLDVEQTVAEPVIAEPAPKPETQARPVTTPTPVRPPAPPPPRNAAIAAIAALSDEEKIALFS